MYCSVADIEKDVSAKTLMELTDTNEPANTINTALVEHHIQTNDALINSHITAISTLPVTDTDDLMLLKKISVALTVCDLFQNRLQTDYSEAIHIRRTDAMNMLKGLSSGVIKLNSTKERTSTGFIKVFPAESVFTKSWRVT